KTDNQSVRMSQSGAGKVTWVATPSDPWMTVSPTSGTGPAVFTIGVQFAPGLPIGGSVAGTVSVAFTGADSVPGPIQVTLTTVAQGASVAPIGVIDTPADGSTGVTGSIPVTGWALDDVEVTRVRIYRDPIDGEAPSLVFIGDAVLVDGARP